MSGAAPGRAYLPEPLARELINTPPSQITLEALRSWLSWGAGGREPRFEARAAVAVPADLRGPPLAKAADGDWGVRHAPGWGADTTVGRIIANGLIFSRSAKLRAAVPYFNKPWDKKTCGAIEQAVVDARLDGRIDPDDVFWVIDRMQWLGYAPTSFLAPSMSIDTLRAPPRTAALKREILAGPRGEAMRSGDLGEVSRVERDLLDSARGELSGRDPGMEIYDSGSRGSFANNYKNTALMRGAMKKSDDPSQIHVSTASLAEGIPPGEMPQYADLIVEASYGRSIMTAVGGYISKQLSAAFQGLSLNPDPESDCGTPLALQVVADDPRQYLYRFYKTPRGLVEITPDSADALRGKPLTLRSPLYCGDQTGICSRCAGTLWYRMGVQQIGLLSNRIGTTLLNASLKAFHDVTVKRTRVSLSTYSKETTPRPGEPRLERAA